ncbi:MAG: cell wall-binding repeat-containing protein [Dermatophilaceae bacterium]
MSRNRSVCRALAIVSAVAFGVACAPSGGPAQASGARLARTSGVVASTGAGAGTAANGSDRRGSLGFSLQRLGGANRYESAVNVSREFFGPPVSRVVVASGELFSDGVAAAPGAARLGGPVLFVKRDHVPEATRAEILRLRPSGIIVLGGPATIPDGVVGELDALAAGGATRISGADRFATAAAMSAAAFPGGASTAYVASGRVWPDALTGGAAAVVQGAPMLLTDTHALPPATRTELQRLHPSRIMLLGGTSSVDSAVANALASIATVERVSGPDRYATALAVSARVFGPGRPGVMLATGSNFPDALAAGAAATHTRGPILLTRGSGLPDGTTDELDRLGPDTAYVLGGTASVPVTIAKAVQRELGVCWASDPPSDARIEAISSAPATSSPRLAFTLDMGGRLEGAADIVRYLTDHQVCTTFFPTSIMASTSEGREVLDLIAAHPELFEVGNHTVHHCDLVLGGGGSPTSGPCQVAMTSTFVRSELSDAESVLRALSGMPIRPFWRPPYGSYNASVQSVVASVGYPKTVLWNRDTIDWDPATTTQQIIDRATSPTPAGGSIVLAHLGGFNTGKALPVIVDTLRARGLTFTTVSGLYRQ